MVAYICVIVNWMLNDNTKDGLKLKNAQIS